MCVIDPSSQSQYLGIIRKRGFRISKAHPLTSQLSHELEIFPFLFRQETRKMGRMGRNLPCCCQNSAHLWRCWCKGLPVNLGMCSQKCIAVVAHGFFFILLFGLIKCCSLRYGRLRRPEVCEGIRRSWEKGVSFLN